MKRYVIMMMSTITNPEPDRRSKDWNKQPTIEAGKRFIVDPLNNDGYAVIQASNKSYAWETGHSDLGKLILKNSVNVDPMSPYELARVHDCDYGADEILRCLLKLGKVCAEDFAAVADAINADENF